MVTYNVGLNITAVSEDISSLVHGFVQTRQNLIASTIKVPGLLERRRAAEATDPVTFRMSPGADGLTANFSTSLAQMEAARDHADGLKGGTYSPFNIWLNGALTFHNREENGNKWGSFSMLSMGADYLLSEKALIGLSFHYDHMTDPTKEDAELTGNGWLAGPYASLEIARNIFFDTSLLYGGSSNTIDTAFFGGSFDTSRWLFDSSINGQWTIDDATVLTPKLRAIYLNEKVDDYNVSNGVGDTIDLQGFTEEQLRVSLGAEVEREFHLKNGATVKPSLGFTAGYAGLNGSGLFGTVTAGISMSTENALTFEAGILLNIEGDGQKSTGAKVGVRGQF